MDKHPGHEEKHATPDSRKSSDNDADDSAKPSKADLARLKLRLIAHYAMLGFAPAVAVLALIIAVTAVTGKQSGQEQISKADAKIDSLNASLSASVNELEKLKAAIAQGKTIQEDRTTKIIQSVTQLQLIVHVSPTLEDELRQSAQAPVASTAAAPAAEAADKKSGLRAK